MFCPNPPETLLRLTGFHRIIWSLRRLPSYLSIQDVPPDVLEEEGWGGSDCPPGSIAVSCQHHLMDIEIHLQWTINPWIGCMPLKPNTPERIKSYRGPTASRIVKEFYLRSLNNHIHWDARLEGVD